MPTQAHGDDEDFVPEICWRLNAAQLFEIDDVIDPADTRRIIAETLTAATAHAEDRPPRRFVDTW